MEAEPRVLELSAWDLQKVSHAYGTNGIITEVEMPLAPAYDWIDVIVGYDSFMEAVKFADGLTHRNGILLKEVAPIAAPIPFDYFTRHKPWLKQGQSVVVLMVAPHSLEPFLAYAQMMKGDIRFRSDTVESMKGIPHAYELAWNHTTLRALKLDTGFTYLQVQYPGPDHVERCARWTRCSPARSSAIWNSSSSTARSSAPACRWCATRQRSG